ncbi:MAG: hypothetical protein Q8P22_13575 [Chloroflexota bacterium]|nr:hypothetical protein [Chloroflexota bacterium]
MRGLLLGATIVLALIVGVVGASAAHAEGPQTTEDEAFNELVLAGAPLAPERVSAASTSGSPGPVTSSALPSSIASPPSSSAVAPAAEAVLPPQLGPQVAPQFPDIPNPVDWFSNLDPRKWAGDILNAILTTIGKALLEAIRGFVDWALGFGDSSLNFVTRTPAEGSYGSPTVRALWDFSRAIVNVLLAIIVMWGGFNIMVKEHTRSPYHEVMELLPRLILGALAANLTLEFARFLIDANNALSAAVGQVGLPGYDAATPTQEGIALIFTALAYGIVAILLVLQMLMRLALIDLLIVLAPVAALLWVLPQTQGWARWWANLFPIVVFQQAIQMMVLRLGSALMVELTPGSLSNALLTLLLGIAVCWLTLKVPAILRGQVHHAGLSSVVSLVLVTRMVGALASTGRGGGAAGATAGRGSQPAPAGAARPA